MSNLYALYALAAAFWSGFALGMWLAFHVSKKERRNG